LASSLETKRTMAVLIPRSRTVKYAVTEMIRTQAPYSSFPRLWTMIGLTRNAIRATKARYAQFEKMFVISRRPPLSPSMLIQSGGL